MTGREERRLRHRVDAVRQRLDERRREVEVRDRELWGESADATPVNVVVSSSPHPYDDATDHPVPRGVRAAADWSWRLLVLVVALGALLWGLWYIRVVTFPLAAAALIAALLGPLVARLRRAGWSRGMSTLVVFLGFLAVLGGSLTYVGQLVSNEFGDVADKASTGLDEILDWLNRSAIGISRDDVVDWFDQLGNLIQANQAAVTEGARSAATLALELMAGLLLMLFALIFFLYDGDRIWRWITRLVPRADRDRLQNVGVVAWRTLGAYTHGVVLVALVDGIFISIVLLIVGVPLAIPLGVLVFFGAFVPFIGAFVTGFLAVLVALVSNGLVAALIVLVGIIAVQQLEGHVLQPFLLGRMVRLHPLGVVVAVATGVLLGGIIGAVLAVPFVAVINSVVRYLTSQPPTEGAGPPTPEQEAVAESTHGAAEGPEAPPGAPGERPTAG